VTSSTQTLTVNLNADLGESFGAWRMGDDESMLPLVNTANVACGFHGGDPLVMRRTVARARECGVSIGAHPSFPDLQGFGRRRMDIAAAELEAMLLYQIGALQALARAERMEVTHVKPHGALSNIACEDPQVAATVARAVRALDPQLVLLAPVLSCLAAAGQEAGLTVVGEVFADRAYADDGTLLSRKLPGAVLHGPEQSVPHVLSMLREGALTTASGKKLPVRVQSICVHGDNPESVGTARAVGEALRAEGCRLVGLPAMVR
jgi:UPF0271 protein